jgi:hypothetical protein
MTATDDLAALLQDPSAFRGAADDLVRSLGIGPVKLAELTLTAGSDRRALLVEMLAPEPTAAEPPEPEQPPPAGVPKSGETLRPEDSWPLSRQHRLRQAAKGR